MGRFLAGNITGETVYCLTVKHPGTGGQVIRVQGNSMDEAVGLLTAAIERDYMTLWHASQQVGFNHQQFTDLNERLNRLSIFVRDNYSYELSTGIHKGQTPEGIAVHYLRKERKRWIVRLMSLFRAKRRPTTIPSDGDDMLPAEWRQP